MSQTDPFLLNTACFLASRYIPGIAPQTIHAMYLQVRHAAINMMWNTPPVPYKSLQALALLCLWSAKIQKEAPMDSWLLSGLSINHAIISFDFLSSAPAERVVDDDMAKKLRLWNALCLSQLQYAHLYPGPAGFAKSDSSAIANGRPFNLQQKYLEHCPRILEHPSATFTDRKVVAEIHLYHITLRLQGDSQTQFTDGIHEEIERWKMNWAHLFGKHPCSAQTSQRLRATATEKHSTLELNLWFCELLLLRSASLQTDSKRLVTEALDKSRLIVSTFLQTNFSTALAYIDQLYFIVGYAALTICDFNVADPLVDQIQSFLIHLSPNEDHIACRFSRAIAEFKRRYSSLHPGAGVGVSGPNPLKRPSSPFPDPLRTGFDQVLFMPSLMDTVPDGYAPLDQFVPEPEFLPTYSLGNMFQGIPVDAGIAGGLVQQS
jgi:hypothetical protein